jgi:cytochrome c oxidase cbb3-type subunit 3
MTRPDHHARGGLRYAGAAGLCAIAIGWWGLSALFDRSLADQQAASVSYAQGLQLLKARCAVCHTVDLVTQQRLDLPHWKATVAKMVHWGAQLSDEEQQSLTEFLAARFSPEAPDAGAADVESSPSPTTGDAVSPAAIRPRGYVVRGKGLYSRNCLPCHGAAAAGGVGPKLAAMPILADESRFWETVIRGRAAMPAWNGILAEQDIADIHAWLRSLR